MIKDSVQRIAFSVQRSRNRNLFFVFLLLSFFLSAVRCPLSAEVLEGIVAIVNDEVITRHDLEEYLAPLYFQYKAEYQGEELQEKLKKLQSDGLRQLIEEKLLLSEARKRKLTVDPKEIQSRLDQVKGRFSSQEEFEETLSRQGLVVEDLEERYRDQIIIGKLVDEEVRYQISVSPSEVTEYYDAHLVEFNLPERIRLKNILIRAEKEEEEEEAFVRIHEIAGMLGDGRSFEELAKQYSQGPNADEGGLMGLVGEGDLSPELETAVFSLPAGKISGVVKSSLGYHLFKVEERIPAQVKPLAEAQQEIQDRLQREKYEIRYKSFIGELRSKAYISLK